MGKYYNQGQRLLDNLAMLQNMHTTKHYQYSKLLKLIFYPNCSAGQLDHLLYELICMP